MRLIDADALLDEVMDRYCEECDKRKGVKNGKFRIIYEVGDAPCRACEIDDVKTELEDAPTVDPVKHGHWEVIDEAEPRRYGCSICKRLSWYETNYCSCCGADMRERKEE